jgi:uracil phosphoribosyltransferase
MRGVTVIDHPLIQHKLTLMRDKTTPTAGFRTLLREIAHLMCYEVTRDLPLETVSIETPMGPMESPVIKGKKLVFASILRAGNGLLDGMLDLVPAARVAHIGIYRDHETLQPVEYYFKAPPDLESRLVIVVDPMLATGNSARRIPTFRSSLRRSTAISTTRAISCRAWAMRVTACTAQSSQRTISQTTPAASATPSRKRQSGVCPMPAGGPSAPSALREPVIIGPIRLMRLARR